MSASNVASIFAPERNILEIVSSLYLFMLCPLLGFSMILATFPNPNRSTRIYLTIDSQFLLHNFHISKLIAHQTNMFTKYFTPNDIDTRWMWLVFSLTSIYFRNEWQIRWKQLCFLWFLELSVIIFRFSNTHTKNKLCNFIVTNLYSYHFEANALQNKAFFFYRTRFMKKKRTFQSNTMNVLVTFDVARTLLPDASICCSNI